MKIEFTKEQYHALLKLVYCWNVLINDVREPSLRIEYIDNMCSYIYSYAKQFWYEDLVECDEDKYYVGEKLMFDEEISGFEEYYHKNSIYLPSNLASRDIEEEYWYFDFEEHSKKYIDILNLYIEEFEENWLNNLRLVK